MSGALSRRVFVGLLSCIFFSVAHTKDDVLRFTCIDEDGVEVLRYPDTVNLQTTIESHGVGALYMDLVEDDILAANDRATKNLTMILPREHLIISDRDKPGIAVHVLPPQELADGTILWDGHVVGRKFYDDEQFWYAKPHCCEAIDQGMLITVSDQEFATGGIGIGERISITIAAASVLMIDEVARDPYAMYNFHNGCKRPEGANPLAPMVIQRKHELTQRFLQGMYTNNTWDPDTNNTGSGSSFRFENGMFIAKRSGEFSLGDYECVGSGEIAVNIFVVLRRIKQLRAPHPYHHQSRAFFENMFVGKEAQAFEAFEYFSIPEFQRYVLSLPGGPERIEEYYENINWWTWYFSWIPKITSRAWRETFGINDSMYEASRHITKMHQKIQELKEAKERRVQEETQKKKWDRENALKKQNASFALQQYQCQTDGFFKQFDDLCANAEYERLYEDGINVHDEYAHVLSQLIFFEQSHISPELFYEFNGTQQQNALHDEMREYLYDNVESMISRSVTINNGAQLAQAVGRNAYQCAFIANVQAGIDADAKAAEFMFLCAKHCFMGAAERVVDVLSHPVEYTYKIVNDLSCAGLVILGVKLLPSPVSTAIGAAGLVCILADVYQGISKMTLQDWEVLYTKGNVAGAHAVDFFAMHMAQKGITSPTVQKAVGKITTNIVPRVQESLQATGKCITQTTTAIRNDITTQMKEMYGKTSLEFSEFLHKDRPFVNKMRDKTDRYFTKMRNALEPNPSAITAEGVAIEIEKEGAAKAESLFCARSADVEPGGRKARQAAKAAKALESLRRIEVNVPFKDKTSVIEQVELLTQSASKIKEFEIQSKYVIHMFSPDHEERGIYKLGTDLALKLLQDPQAKPLRDAIRSDLVEKMKYLVRLADARGLLAFGSNQIETLIKGYDAIVRVRIDEAGKVLSFNLLFGTSDNKIGNTFTLISDLIS